MKEFYMKNREFIKGLLVITLIFITGLLLQSGNDNNISYIDGILSSLGVPIWSNGVSGTHYAGLYMIILLVLEGILLVRYGDGLRKGLSKYPFITMLVIILFTSYVNEGTIKVSKAFQNGADSLYVYRKECKFKYRKINNSNNENFIMELKLKNMSNKEVKCKVWLVSVYEFIDDKILMGEIEMMPGARENIRLQKKFDFVNSNSRLSGESSTFKFALEDDKNFRVIDLVH